jgi:hypothetical protein
MMGMEDEPPSSRFFGFLGKKSGETVLEQVLSREAYEEYRQLLMRARPEVKGSKLVVRLPDGVIELDESSLKVKAKNRKTAEKILRNLHHYEGPPSLWPAYGLSYSLRRRKRLVL